MMDVWVDGREDGREGGRVVGTVPVPPSLYYPPLLRPFLVALLPAFSIPL